jgi:type II secretory pathway pseudopilin PulG
MRKQFKNQKGFSHVEVLLLTIIVGIIAAVGWYVWHSVSQADKSLSSADSTTNAAPSKKNTSKQTSSSSVTSPATAKTVSPASPVPASIVSPAPTYVTTTPTVINNYITINDWNIKFKHSGSITIMYAHDSHDKNHRSIFFSSFQLLSKNKACKAEFYPGGYIVRYKGPEHVYGDDDKDSGKTAEQYSQDLAKSSVAFGHVGDYFYFYHGPKGKCADLKEIQDLQNQTVDAVKAFLLSLQAI